MKTSKHNKNTQKHTQHRKLKRQTEEEELKKLASDSLAFVRSHKTTFAFHRPPHLEGYFERIASSQVRETHADPSISHTKSAKRNRCLGRSTDGIGQDAGIFDPGSRDALSPEMGGDGRLGRPDH